MGITAFNSFGSDSKILRNCSDKTPPKDLKIHAMSGHGRRYSCSTIHKNSSVGLPICLYLSRIRMAFSVLDRLIRSLRQNDRAPRAIHGRKSG
jgi:hypothetical protein